MKPIHKLVLIITVLLTACNAERRFNDYSIKHPDKFKQLAAVLAPCVEVNPKSDTIYRTKIDTLITAGNTVVEHRNDTVFITKQLAGKTITKYETQTVTKTVADSRALDACELRVVSERDRANKAETEHAATKKNLASWRLAFFILLGVVIGWFFISKYIGSAFRWLKGLFK